MWMAGGRPRHTDRRIRRQTRQLSKVSSSSALVPMMTDAVSIGILCLLALVAICTPSFGRSHTLLNPCNAPPPRRSRQAHRFRRQPCWIFVGLLVVFVIANRVESLLLSVCVCVCVLDFGAQRLRSHTTQCLVLDKKPCVFGDGKNPVLPTGTILER